MDHQKNVFLLLTLTVLHKRYGYIGIIVQNNMAKSYVPRYNSHVTKTSATCMKYCMYPANLGVKFSMH